MQSIRELLYRIKTFYRTHKVWGRIILFTSLIPIVCCCCFLFILAMPTPENTSSTTPVAAVTDSLAVASTETLAMATYTVAPTETIVPEESPTPTETNTPAESLTPTNTRPPTNTPIPSATKSPEQVLRKQVEETLGDSNRDIPRISEMFNEQTQNDIFIQFTANDILFESMTIRGIQMDIINILETVYKSRTPLPYKSVTVVATFPLVDVYGNEKESIVVAATYTRATLEKINWDNFLTDNIYTIAVQDTLFIHPAAKP